MEKYMIMLALWTCLMKVSCTTQHFDGPEVETQLPSDFILEWNEIAYHAFGGKAYQHTLMASRINAMTHLAMHDALNTIYPVPGRYAYTNFWYEFSETALNRVSRIIALNKNLGLWETARLFALENIAMADAYIAGWESKFYHNFWRPYTVIHNAFLDGNDQTEADLQWEPSRPTPPVWEYPSTHSALGNAAAKVLASILGDETLFTLRSTTVLPGSSDRSFISFGQAADENADSRVKAGLHFRFACDAGQEMGDNIGQYVVSNHLRPLK